MNSLFLRLLATSLLLIWLILVLLGKSGAVHMLLLTGISVAFIELICVYRQRVKAD